MLKVVPKKMWRYPMALEREYSKYLVGYVEKNMNIVKRFLPDMEELLLVYGLQADAPVHMEVLLDRIQRAMIPPEQMRPVANAMSIRVDRYNQQEWEAMTKSVLGMPLSEMPDGKIHQDAEADDVLRELWVAENLDLIKSVDEQTMQRIKAMLQERIVGNVNRRELAQGLAREVEHITGLEKNRAALIARDQVGKLNGRLMQYRQTHAGITEYKWSTSHDQRVRASHRALDGKVFSWDNPPSEGHPGMPIRCRCVALPVIDLGRVVTKPVPGSYTQVEKVNIGGEAQEYKPVTVSKAAEAFPYRNQDITIRKLTSTSNGIYSSDSVNLKPKAIHIIDKSITETLQLIKPPKTALLPKIIIVSMEEMQTGALAKYIPGKNTMLMLADIGDPKKVVKLQKGMACSDNPLSTYVHEFLHWKDAMEYICRYGRIDSSFFKVLRQKSKKRLDKLGYVIYNNISKYASIKFEQGLFEEPDVEYRTRLLLGGGKNEGNPST